MSYCLFSIYSINKIWRITCLKMNESSMKILIIQNKRIGDVLISSVIANNFKAKYPISEIHFMAYDFTHGVIINNPNIDK